MKSRGNSSSTTTSRHDASSTAGSSSRPMPVAERVFMYTLLVWLLVLMTQYVHQQHSPQPVVPNCEPQKQRQVQQQQQQQQQSQPQHPDGEPQPQPNPMFVRAPENMTTTTTARTKGGGGEDDGGIIPIAFEPWPTNRPLPCHAPDFNNQEYRVLQKGGYPQRRGILFLKTFKTGSSTAAGVTLRIARNLASRTPQHNYTFCRARWEHHTGMGQTMFKKRIPHESFLWTILREPQKRAVSHFFFNDVSRQEIEPTVENFISFMHNSSSSWYEVEDMYMKSLPIVVAFNRSKHDPIQHANTILSEYNFIAVMERMDESLVALAMLMHIPLADVLYLNAKSSGGFDDGSTGKCVHIQSTIVSPEMKAYMESDDFQNRIKYDRLLYQAVYKSLDLTIERLGREEFEKKLKIFKDAVRRAEEVCRPVAKFPCREGRQKAELKTRTDCLWADSGCGTPCLDRVANELGLDKL